MKEITLVNTLPEKLVCATLEVGAMSNVRDFRNRHQVFPC